MSLKVEDDVLRESEESQSESMIFMILAFRAIDLVDSIHDLFLLESFNTIIKSDLPSL